MISHYWWQGAIERAEEVVMIIKTRAGLAEPVRAAVKEMHSYTTPAVLVIPIETVDPDYHAWIVGGDEGSGYPVRESDEATRSHCAAGLPRLCSWRRRVSTSPCRR